MYLLGNAVFDGQIRTLENVAKIQSAEMVGQPAFLSRSSERCPGGAAAARRSSSGARARNWASPRGEVSRPDALDLLPHLLLAHHPARGEGQLREQLGMERYK